MRAAWTLLLAAVLCAAALQPAPAGGAGQEQTDRTRPRLREAGVKLGVLPPGKWNAITDVEGVLVGHRTLRRGDSIRTGITAIRPHDGNLFREKVPAAVFVANGFGKLTGVSQIRELGTLETPILLTGTLNVPRVADGLVDHMLALPGNEEVRSINPVVGETNDGYLSDIRSRPLGAPDVAAALESARSGPVEEGSVGAGTGTVAFGYKGGIGTASRRLPATIGGWTVGVLVQTNFGGALRIGGVPVGRELGRYYLRSVLEPEPERPDAGMPGPSDPDGSCMIVVATDAPLDARSLERLALRAFMGMARTGASGSNGSGDYVIAFSTSPALRSGPDAGPPSSVQPLSGGELSPLFFGAIEATEEAILNSLFRATTVSGHRGTVEALPLEATLAILRRHRVLEDPQRFP